MNEKHSLADDLLELEQKNIQIWVEEESLRYKAPKGALTPEILDYLKTNRETIIRHLKAGNAKRIFYEPILPVPEQAYYPLSAAQKRMYFLNQMDQESTAYNLTQVLRINGEVEPKKLEMIIQQLASRHPSMRTSFELIDGLPVQRIHRTLDFQLEDQEMEDRPGMIDQTINEFIRPYDLAKPPLFRMKLVRLRSNSEFQPLFYLFFDLHHIISDGISLGILIQEINDLYAGRELPPLKIQYQDYVAWQEKLLNSEEIQIQKQYWLQKLKGEIPLLNLIPDRPRPSVYNYEGDSWKFPIGKELTDKLSQLARENKATLFMVLLAAYNVFLAKLTGQNEIIVGTPTGGRRHPSLNSIIGVFINTLVLRNHPEPDRTFRSFLKQVAANVLEDFDHQDYPFEQLVENLNLERDLSRNPLFDTMFSLPNMKIDDIDVAGYQTSWHEFKGRISQFDLALIATENKNGIELEFTYCTALFHLNTIERWARYLIRLLEEIVKNPGSKLADLEMVPEDEKYQLRYHFNNTRIDFPNLTIPELFEKQVEKTPQSLAVMAEDQNLTYTELNRRANQLARVLRAEGVVNESIVGVMLERSSQTIVGILGIQKAGGAYLPIDPEYPTDRVGYMLRHSKTKILITEGRLREKAEKLMKLENNVGIIINLSGEFREEIPGLPKIYHPEEIQAQPDENLPVICRPADLMYLIYTSGSTGLPKGVMVTQANAANYLQWSIRDAKLGESDRMLLVTSISFDISVFEIFGALLSGAGLSIASGEKLRDGNLLLQYLEEMKNTIWHSVPTLMAQILLILKNHPERDKFSCLLRIRRVMIGGEAWSVELAREIRAFFPRAVIVNMYGPTETTIWVTSYQIGDELAELNTIPIGKPIANNQVLILDQNRKLCGIGVPGDLYISGANITRGYYRDEAKTCEVFLTDPENGTVIYRTGDTARFLADGNIEYLGRKDGMVKVRGYRIEVGEIENALRTREEIVEAAVVAKKMGDTNKLVCFYTARTPFSPGELRDYLQAKLPEYMIPSQFNNLEQMPLTPNGKIDRKSLSALEITGRPQLENEFIEPATEAEKYLAALWQELLGTDRIGIGDNFFSLGGNSFLVSQMQSKIETRYPQKVKIVDIFKYPTIMGLAQYLTEGGPPQKYPIDKQIAVDLIKLLKQEAAEPVANEIAIIGMAARFPQAENTGEFWVKLHDGVDFVAPLPAARRKDADPFHRIYSRGEGRAEYAEGAFLEAIDKFDYGFFRLSPREASLMDPNQRLFLQTAWQAVEDAGYGGSKIQGTRTGVYVGYSSDFGELYRRFIQDLDPSDLGLAVPGNIKSIIAGRIAFLLDLKGPSMLVDTACSSALAAVHLACRGIRNGECEMAIAGGVRIVLLPLKFDEQQKIGIESSDYRAKTFDDSSDGTGAGEGVAAVLLKPLSKALEDHDPIHAVIKGSALNQDGSSIGITAPNSTAQTDVIIRAWKDAGVAPETITYIEAHGTGTKLGDPLEIDGMETAFRSYTSKKQFCAVGSVKTNIGHLDNAAGIAGLVKAVLALKNRKIPPSLHFQKPNRKINFAESPVYVNDRLSPWETEDFPRRCGISAFGLSGTNCHMILEEPPVRDITPTNGADEKVRLLTLSARGNVALGELVRKYREFIEKNSVNLDDLCYTANTGRGHYSHRLAVIFCAETEFQEKMRAIDPLKFEEINVKDIYYGKHQTVINKKPGQSGVISEAEKRRLSQNADQKIRELPTFAAGQLPAALAEIAHLYVNGADPAWEEMYRPEKRNRLHLPVYPFEPKRCWLNVEPGKLSGQVPRSEAKEIAHPLLDRLAVNSFNQDVYITEFSIERHWELREHRVAGSCLPPGTTYLEMIRAIRNLEHPGQPVELKEVLFIAPLILAEGESRQVQTIVKTETDPLEFLIVSQPEPGTEWIRHAEGKITAAPSEWPPEPSLNLAAIKSRCPEQITAPEPQPGDAVETGPRWNNYRYVFLGENELLAPLELPEEFHEDLQLYGLHPALMDSAVNIANIGAGEGLYLPWAYKELRIFGTMPAKIYCYLRGKGKTGTKAETATFDITLTDEQGKVFAAIRDYTVKKVPEMELKSGVYAGQGSLYHEIVWVPVDRSEKSPDPETGNVLLFKDRGGIGEKIAKALQNSGREVIEVKFGSAFRKISENQYLIGGAPDDYANLMNAVQEKGFSQIIHLSPVESQETPEDPAGLEKAQRMGVFSLFYLTRALIGSKIKGEIKMFLIAGNANAVTKKEEIIHPHHAAFFGLGKVVGQEYEQLKCRCLDIDGQTTAEDIIGELEAADRKERVAYRNGGRYVEEFRGVEIEQLADGEIAIKDSGVYVITGGTGGLGLEVGKYLASRNRVNLALISRFRLPERADWDRILEENEDGKLAGKLRAIRSMEAAGATVSCYSADVAEEKNLKSVIGELREKYGRINGIIHCAGMAGDGFLISKDEEVFSRVLAPKVTGTWLLDRLTREDKPDFFVVFSSINAFLGGPGQGDYTAANAYLDSFAAFRKRMGYRTQAINWAAWRETGMAAEYGINEAGEIFKPLPTARAIKAFEDVLGKEIDRVIVGELNMEAISAVDGDLGINLSNDLREAMEKRKARRKTGKKAETRKPAASLVMVGKGEAGFNETEQKVARIWAEVLGLEEVNIYDNFNDLGGDSILATRLLREMEKEFAGQVDISDIFTYATINEMAEYLEGKRRKEPGALTNIELNVEEIMNRLARGEIDIEEADRLMKGKGGK